MAAWPAPYCPAGRRLPLSRPPSTHARLRRGRPATGAQQGLATSGRAAQHASSCKGVLRRADPGAGQRTIRTAFAGRQAPPAASAAHLDEQRSEGSHPLGRRGAEGGALVRVEHDQVDFAPGGSGGAGASRSTGTPHSTCKPQQRLGLPRGRRGAQGSMARCTSRHVTLQAIPAPSHAHLMFWVRSSRRSASSSLSFTPLQGGTGCGRAGQSAPSPLHPPLNSCTAPTPTHALFKALLQAAAHPGHPPIPPSHSLQHGVLDQHVVAVPRRRPVLGEQALQGGHQGLGADRGCHETDGAGAAGAKSRRLPCLCPATRGADHHDEGGASAAQVVPT